MRVTLVLGSVLFAGCVSYTPNTRTVRIADLNNNDRTRLTGRFQWDDGDLEYPPPGQSPESVTDTAVLGVNAENRLCVHLTMRTGAKHDAPFGEWAIKINGEPVFPEGETVGQHTVYAQGERTVVDAAYVGRHSASALTVTEPTTDEYAIIERSAWFCPVAVPAGKVAVTMNRKFGFGSKMREEFIWTLLN